MTKKLTVKRRASFSRMVIQWAQLHKMKTGLIAVAALIAGAAAYGVYANYASTFSRDDFDRLTSMAETVLQKTSSSKVYTDRTCSYNHGEFITTPTLSCRVSMVMYLPYTSDAKATSVANLYRTNIDGIFDKQTFSFSTFYSKPHDGYGISTASAQVNGKVQQCNFYVQSNRNARSAVAFLPEQKDDNLIALSFECNAPARSEYFPVEE